MSATALTSALTALSWGRPWAFALLPLAAWVAPRHARQAAVEDVAGVRLLHPDLHGVLAARAHVRPPSATGVLVAAAFACFVVALARPQWLDAWVLPAARGRDVVVVLDTTRSMTLHDLSWNGEPAQRLAVVKQVFARFVEGSPGDRFGIVVYGAHAATLLRPTFDRQLAVQLLQRARANRLGDGGCLGDAIVLALRQLDRAGALKPVLVVYSDDGWSQGGQVSPAQAAALARALGVRVFAVQVGGSAAAGSTYKVPAFSAPQPDLRSLASLTGGRYFYAAEPGAQQRAVATIARLAPTLQPPARRRTRELAAWPLGLGIVLLAWGRAWPMLGGAGRRPLRVGRPARGDGGRGRR